MEGRHQLGWAVERPGELGWPATLRALLAEEEETHVSVGSWQEGHSFSWARCGVCSGGTSPFFPGSFCCPHLCLLRTCPAGSVSPLVSYHICRSWDERCPVPLRESLCPVNMVSPRGGAGLALDGPVPTTSNLHSCEIFKGGIFSAIN